MNNLTRKVINNLKELREHVGISQSKIAEVLGVDQGTYSRYENSDGEYLKKNLNIKQTIDLTNFYGLNSLNETIALLEGKYNEYLQTNEKRF